MQFSRPGPHVVLLLALAVGCSDHSLTAPIDPGDALYTISDGAHNGMEGFYFLPPLVKAPSYSGTFDPNLSPVVDICETPACTAIHARFTMTDGTGSEIVRVDEAAQHYKLNWHTDQTGTVVGQTYRIRVSVAGAVFGHADIQIAGNGREARNSSSDDMIRLLDGRTLPVQFRIEAGARPVVGPEGGFMAFNGGAVTLDIPEGALQEQLAISVVPVSDDLNDPDVVPGALYDFGPSPYRFEEPVILSIRFDPARLPDGIAPGELRLLGVVDGEWVQLPGSSVNVANSTVSGPVGSFSRKGVGRGKVHAIAVWPEDASIDVGETLQFEATVTNVDGEEMDRTPQWSSSDDAVAMVSTDGLVTGDASGSATITASAGAVSGSASLVVGDVPAAFVTRWNTNLGEGTTVTLALAGTVDGTINWGDGTITPVTGPGPHVHDYGVNGIYTVSVVGAVTAYNSQINGGSTSEVSKLTDVVAWGEVGFTDLSSAFYGADNLVAVPTSSAGIEDVIIMNAMFWNATSFNGDIGGWNTGSVLLMSGMFAGATSFNGDIGGWNTGNVMNMNTMFWNATSFNQDIGGWNTGSVTHMNSMFWNAASFNGDIGAWNTGNVTTMNRMFSGAAAFNQDIGAWNTGNVTDMRDMFRDATSFNQDIGAWNTGNVTNMIQMFGDATAFNQDIGAWNTGNVTNMNSMFANATTFNQDIGGWDTGNVTDMTLMFRNAASFNRNLAGWCVANITSVPSGFDIGATSWTLARPVWGTCPVDGLSWHTMGGMGSTVAALAEYNGDLIAGGGFITAGGVTANRIARWDGAEWHAMGTFSHVSALAEYNGELIAGGNFGISRWDGTSWQSMSTTSNYLALTLHDGELIAGGWFTSVGGVSANRIARWDGSQWRALGSGTSHPVTSLTVFNGDLIAGGSFTTAGGVSASYIARWDGEQWHPIGSGMGGIVHSLTVYNGELIAGGRFNTAGGVTANHIARWNGSQWQPIGSGMDGFVLSLTVYNGGLIAGGEFTTAGGVTANHIARWDGLQWQPIGSGMDVGSSTSVRSLVEFHGDLIAGGVFYTIEGQTVNHIARWGTQ